MANRRHFVKEGQRFGKLTVINEFAFYDGKYFIRKVNCICDCGKHTTPLLAGLYKKKNSTKSCGCRKKEYTLEIKHKGKHMKSGTRLYKVWIDMKTRVYNKNSKSYKDYGARGITMYKRWLNFNTFFKWASTHGYQNGLRIERINNDGNYTPYNCRFATHIEQCNNTRRNRIILYDNKKYSATQFSREMNLSINKVEYRIKNGITDARRLLQLCK